MKAKAILFQLFILYFTLGSCRSTDTRFKDAIIVDKSLSRDLSEDMDTVCAYTEKMTLGYHNPISDYMFFADPTAVEYDGRLYVYGTNDSQQLDETSPDKPNSYEKIHSFQVVSTEDMVNWTYHGIIDTKIAAPKGLGVSWAPSIVSRKEADGQTHFYMFFSSSGSGVGLITSTSPLGPWYDPIGGEFVDYSSTEIGDCPNPFDPGAVIAPDGTAWLAFGAGVAKDGSDYLPKSQRLCKLSPDMTKPDGEYIKINAPYHFEANELNIIGGQLVYIFNTNWVERSKWDRTDVEAPSLCCMSYMKAQNPLDGNSWTYQDNILPNPGDLGMGHSNNHTHLHKYKSVWYMMYHTVQFQYTVGVTGGYRSICIDPIDVDEAAVKISRGKMTHEGVAQLSPIDGRKFQPASQASATHNIKYEATEDPGMMVVHANAPGQGFRVSGVASDKVNTLYVRVKGKGALYLRKNGPKGQFLARAVFDADDWSLYAVKLAQPIIGQSDLYFSVGSGDFLFKEWALN